MGAWGLGWEIWLDGMEITQFTYFQQCGGYDCYPVCAEITYGLERIAMYIQNKKAFSISNGWKASLMLTCITRVKWTLPLQFRTG